MTHAMTKAMQRNPVAPLQESTHQLVEDAGLYARQQLETGIESVKNLRAGATDQIKEHPLTTVLAALGIGLVIGALVRR